MTENINDLLLRLQKRLELTDWNIEVEFIPREEMLDFKVEANIYHNWERKEAKIRIVKEEVRAKTVLGKAVSTEELLLHELLHLLFLPSYESRTDIEISINTLVRALLKQEKKE